MEIRVFAFLEAMLTVFLASIASVWTITGIGWPPLPAVVLGLLGGAVAGLRRVNALLTVPPTAAVLLALALGGCTGTAELVKALSEDKSSGCFSVNVALYGSIVAGRVNTPGAEVDIMPGHCNFKAPK